MPGSDIEILKLWSASGNADAFAELVRRYAPLVYSAALRVLRNSADAEDVAQQCFLELAQRPPAIRSTLAGWLHRLATHRALNHLRGEKRRTEREATFEATRAAAETKSWAAVAGEIDEAIAALKPAVRDVITRRYFLGESPEDVAAALGIAKRTVRHRQQQGINAIRAALKRKGVVTTSGLAALLAANLRAGADALPDTLSVQLGKLALSGMRPLAPSAAWQWPFAAPPATLAIVALPCAIVLGAIVYVVLQRPSVEPNGAQNAGTLSPTITDMAAVPTAEPLTRGFANSATDAAGNDLPVSMVSLHITDSDGAPVPGATLLSGDNLEPIAKTGGGGTAELAELRERPNAFTLRTSDHTEQSWHVLPKLLHEPIRVESVMFKQQRRDLRVYTADGKPLDGVDILRKDDGLLLGRTDASGYVSFPKDGRKRLRHPDYGTQDLSEQRGGGRDGHSLVVYLAPPAALIVTATLEGAPVRGAVITCTNCGTSNGEDTAGDEGRVRFSGLIPGKQYAFTARLDRKGEAPLIAYGLAGAYPEEERAIMLELAPPPSVAEGMVRWESGKPCADQTVLVSTPNADRTMEVRTSADGRFRAPLFPDFNILQLKELPENASQKAPLRLRGSARTPVVQGDIILAPRAVETAAGERTITLDFVADEAPVELELIEADNSQGATRYILATPEDAVLRLGLAPGAYLSRLIVADRSNGYAGLCDSAMPAPSRAETVRLDVPVGSVCGTLRDQHGNPVPYGNVQVRSVDWPSLSAQADKEGHFEAWPIPLGKEVLILADALGYFKTMLKHTPGRTGEETTLTLTRPDTQVVGRVVYADGSPVPRGSVRCGGPQSFNTTFAIRDGRFSGELVPGAWSLLADDGLTQTRGFDVTVPHGEIVLAFEDAPVAAEPILTAEQQELENHLKQMGLVFKMFANESRGTVFPPISQTFGRFMPEMEVIYPEYATDSILLDRLAGAGQERFCYLGFVLEDEATALALLDVYENAGPEGLQGDEIAVASRDGETEPAVLQRFSEGNPESEQHQSEMPVLWQVPDPETGDGGWVLYMDGHTEWKPYPSEFPMTEAVTRRVRELQEGAE